MTRPKKARLCCCEPRTCCFKPQGLNCCGGVELFSDELGALKLHDVDGLDQKQAAGKMGVSQPTFARILKKAQKKLAEAVVGGKIINLREEEK